MLLHTINDVRERIKQWKKEGLTVGLVPTMGALHAGHLSLIKKSVEKCDRTVVSVFVNPIQFCPGEDLDKYPRTLDADKKLCNEAGVDIVFAPSPKEMYGEGHILSNDFLTYVIPPYFYVDKLCGKSRVGHFDGVETVVTKLFNIVQPDYACFGMKDIQQLFLIKKMVKDLNFPIEIIPCPLVREESGLALSSRNKYLTEEQKKAALSLSKALFAIRDLNNEGIKETKKLFDTGLTNLDKNVELEYLEFVDFDTFKQVNDISQKTICALAARVGNVRLIDNIVLEV